MGDSSRDNDHLVRSSDPDHPANLIPDLCRKFYNLGWVTGTGGGVSNRRLMLDTTSANQRCVHSLIF